MCKKCVSRGCSRRRRRDHTIGSSARSGCDVAVYDGRHDWCINAGGLIGRCGGMDTSEMLVEVFCSRKSFARMSFAGLMGTVQRVSWATMLAMHFSFVTKKTPGIGEPWQLLAAICYTTVWTFMLIHMLTKRMLANFLRYVMPTKIGQNWNSLILAFPGEKPDVLAAIRPCTLIHALTILLDVSVRLWDGLHALGCSRHAEPGDSG